MTYSLNEVMAQARKAARGAGFDWGMAEEAARAARWLCARGIDGCAILAGCLEAAMAGQLATAPQVADGAWRAPDARPLCPIHIGAALSDRAASLAHPPAHLRIGPVFAPALLLPFVAQIARQGDMALRVDANTASCIVTADGPDAANRFSSAPQSINITHADARPTRIEPFHRATPDATAWDMLTRLAHLTYAPATDASRAKGAGGDLPDND